MRQAIFAFTLIISLLMPQSAAAAVGSAAAEILAAHFGVMPFANVAGVIDDESAQRRYTTFEAAAYEAGMAELYAGAARERRLKKSYGRESVLGI